MIATRSTASGAVVVVSFFAPAIPAWFTIDVDGLTWRKSRNAEYPIPDLRT